jgi:hypothetical protein
MKLRQPNSTEQYWMRPFFATPMAGNNGNEKDTGEKHSVSRHNCVNYFQKGAL